MFVCSSSRYQRYARLCTVCNALFVFSLRIIAMFKLCAIFHGLLALPLGIIGILDCLLSVMVCLFSLCKRYARWYAVCHGLFALFVLLVC